MTYEPEVCLKILRLQVERIKALVVECDSRFRPTHPTQAEIEICNKQAEIDVLTEMLGLSKEGI